MSTTELDLSYSTVLGLHAEIAALKAERDAAQKLCRRYMDAEIRYRTERDRLRAALEAACSALEYNDENEAYGILREACRALRQNEPEK
jgi:hypothetical protein